MLMPLQLSPQGVLTAHASMFLKGICSGEEGCPCCLGTNTTAMSPMSPPYYSPTFWCTARAICFGPGDTALFIFPQDEPIACFANPGSTLPTILDAIWALRMDCDVTACSPFVFPRHTGLDSILSRPQISSGFVAVTNAMMDELRNQFSDFLTPPVPQSYCPILLPPSHHDNNDSDGVVSSISDEENIMEEEEEEEEEEKKDRENAFPPPLPHSYPNPL